MDVDRRGPIRFEEGDRLRFRTDAPVVVKTRAVVGDGEEHRAGE